MNTPCTAAAAPTGLLRRIRAKGLAGTLRAVLDRIQERVLERFFEWRLGISTAGTMSWEALGHPRAEYGAYGPTPYGNIQRTLAALGIRPGREVFVDFGSGKGRVVIMAARHPFARVIGVERSPELADIARRNLDRARALMRCGTVEVVTADAAAYEVPDDTTVAFFASPFSGEILDAVLANLQASLMRAPRRFRVISHGYDAGNWFESQLRRCDWLSLDAEVRLQRGHTGWIYVNARWRAD